MYQPHLKGIFFIFFLLTIFKVSGQGKITDSVFTLKSIEIATNRLDNFGTGTHTEKIDSLSQRFFSNENLAELLFRQNQVFLKTYGSGGLGTVSIRGTSASHTAILWNGINLQSPMNGAMDLALIPVSFQDDIRIQYGGNGALFGSGAMGGTILLNSQPDFNSGLNTNISLDAGSFMNLGGKVSLEAGTERSFTSFRAIYQYGKNNFPFTNHSLAGSPKVHQSHASIDQYGVMLAQHLLIGSRNRLSVNLWYQNSEREIPPLMTQYESQAKQYDISYRGAAEWQYTQKKTSVFVRTVFVSEMQHYTDSFPTIDSHNNFFSSVTETEVHINPGKHHLINCGMNNTFEEINTNNYIASVNRDRISLYVNYRYKTINEKFATSASIREEYDGSQFLPPVPSLGAEYYPWKNTQLRISGAGIYRLPSFNDLYWNPGGNLDLKPETGWSEEIGILQKIKYKKLNTEISVSAFNNNIRNWIIWLPAGAYFSPRNLMEVWGRGVESSFKFNFALKKWFFSIDGRYNYTRSTNRKAKNTGDASLGKQIIYTPMHIAAGTLMVSFRGYTLSYHHQYTGIRYLATDNSDFIPAYHTADLVFGKSFKINPFTLDLSIAIENIWNEQYQAIAWMPMPGRVFKGTLSLQFHKPLKSKSK
jgi:vitamin B12 transporter